MRAGSLCFVGSGVVLVVLTVAGYLHWIAALVEGDRGWDDVSSPGSAGLLAVVLGWSAFARSYVGAGLRPAAAAVLTGVGAAALFGVSKLVEGNPNDEFKPVSEYYVDPWITVNSLIVLAVVAWFVLAALAVMARAATDDGNVLRGLMVGVLVLVVLFDGVLSGLDGSAAGVALSLLSPAWLGWALARARAARAATGRTAVGASA